MANHKKKKKKDQVPTQVFTNNNDKDSRESKKKFFELPAFKKYIPFIGLAAVIMIVFYFLFGRGIRISYKQKQLKNLNVILLTLDTLRADFVGAYGKGKAETPNMDRMADEGVLFETCIAQTPLTLPSHTSILSGSYPMYHQVRDNGGFMVPGSLDFISEVLQKQGFTTAAFIATYVLHSKWGVNQGFNTYSDDFDLTKYKKISLGNVQKRADEVLKNAREWLAQNKNKKFFSWIHLYDPHTPYAPPSPFKEKFAQQPYRGEVEYLDYELGLFFDWLKQEGLYDNTLIIMMADHGESLGEHDEDTHGFFIYEPTVRIPLIIRAPFSFPQKRIKVITESIDVAPTILEALGVPIPASYQGQSLLGLMFGNKDRVKNDAYTETYYPRLHYGWSELKAMYYNKNWKFIQAPKQELYNLEMDAGEKENLALKESVEARRARTRLQEFSAQKAQNARKVGETLKLDKEDLQKLAALGYFTNTVDTANKTDLPDPKGKVGVFNNLAEATKLMQDKNYTGAIKILESVIAENPQIVDGILQLGNAYTENKMHKEALACFYRVLDQKPDYQAAMVNVINSLIRLGELDKGIEEIQRFFKTFPRDHTLYNELGTIYFMKKDYEKSLAALKKSLEIEQINPNSLSRLGEIYVIKKDYSTAENFLNRAKAINAALPKLYFNLAQVEEARGNMAKAVEYYKIEVENSPDAYKSAYNAAENLRNTGRYDEAIEYYRKAIDGNPQFNIPYFMIAKCFLDRRTDIDEAIRLCEQGIELKPMNKYTVFGYYILADIYSFKGDQARSNDYFAKGNDIKRILIQKKQWDREI